MPLSRKPSKGARDPGHPRTPKGAGEAGDGRAFELGEVLEFMRLLWGVNHGLEASSKQMDAALGVTGPQRLVLRIVGRNPEISAGSLAQIMHVHPSTLTGVLSRLEGRSLLAREADPADRRRALFSLTPQGKALDSLRAGTVEARVRGVLARLPAPRIAAAQEVLDALAQALAAPPARPAKPEPKRASTRKARS